MSLPPLAHTLLLPLWGRAAYHRYDPARRDALAERLLADIGGDRAELDRTLGDYGVLAFGRRAAWMDEQVRAWVAAHPRAQLVNLGGGLDAPLHRLGEGEATCLTVDLPEVIALRQAHIPSHPRETLLAARLEAEEATTHIDTARPALVLLVGVSMYLPPAAFIELMTRLDARLAPGSRVVFDGYSATAAAITNLLIRATGLTDAPVYASAARVAAIRAAAPTLDLVERADLWGPPAPRGLTLWTRAQIAFARWTAFTTLYTWERQAPALRTPPPR